MPAINHSDFIRTTLSISSSTPNHQQHYTTSKIPINLTGWTNSLREGSRCIVSATNKADMLVTTANTTRITNTSLRLLFNQLVSMHFICHAKL